MTTTFLILYNYTTSIYLHDYRLILRYFLSNCIFIINKALIFFIIFFVEEFANVR